MSWLRLRQQLRPRVSDIQWKCSLGRVFAPSSDRYKQSVNFFGGPALRRPRPAAKQLPPWLPLQAPQLQDYNRHAGPGAATLPQAAQARLPHTWLSRSALTCLAQANLGATLLFAPFLKSKASQHKALG